MGSDSRNAVTTATIIEISKNLVRVMDINASGNAVTKKATTTKAIVPSQCLTLL
jgi:hypothetical protein